MTPPATGALWEAPAVNNAYADSRDLTPAGRLRRALPGPES
ncbi:hypothetical protein [Dactylosporangium sp. NPDC000521]